jgi:tetratricopeptide (TPR) repeat protein
MNSIKSTGLRDGLVLGGIAAIVVVAYLVAMRPFASEEEPESTQQAMPASHEESMAEMEGFPETYEALVPMGNDLMDQGNFPMAAECYKRALALQDDDNVRVDFGACLHGMGMPVRAIEEFMTVIADNPNHAIAHYNLGIVYSTQQMADSARLYFEKYLEIDPQGPAAASAREFMLTL